jgi:uncharacterized membrane protein YfcA
MISTDWVLAYLAIGAVAGFLAGLFGIGGGLLLVPVLLFSFDAQHFDPRYTLQMALGTTMATILFTSVSSALKHHKHRAVNWRVVRFITPGILLGTALGAFTTTRVSVRVMGAFFALFVYFAAAQILLGARPKAARQLPGFWGMSGVGAFIGWVSSLVSIGGGTVSVPFMVWCNVPIRNAIGTSAAIGFPIAVGGTIGYILTGLNIPGLPAMSMGFVYVSAMLWVATASIVTAPFGARATHYMNVELLRKLFAVLLLILATKLLLKVL